MKSSPLGVFVYGTLKPGYANYVAYCQGKVISAIPSYTFGNLYALPMGYPAMTVGNNQVHGWLLLFSEAQILASLDRLEGYHPDRLLIHNQYYRASVPVYDADHQAISQAWAYYMTSTRVQNYRGIALTSGCWQG